MPLHYRISKRRNNLSSSGEMNYILQAISTGEVDIERLSQEISNSCSLTRSDVHAVLISLGELLERHLADGKIVSLDNIGRFKIGFKSESKSSPELLRPKDISKFHINYQPTVKLKHWLKKGLQVRKEKGERK